jgi:hypothetical protein
MGHSASFAIRRNNVYVVILRQGIFERLQSRAVDTVVIRK